MAFLKIPIDAVQPYHEFNITLDEVTFIMKFSYNFRSNRWSMAIKDEENNVIVAGVPLVLGASLLAPYYYLENLPKGKFFVIDVNGDNTEPTKDSFGNTHELFYQEAVE